MKKENKRTVVTTLAELLMPKFPDLKKKLQFANISQTPIVFLEKAITASSFLSLTLLVITGFFIFQLSLPIWYIFPLALIYPVLSFFFFALYPDAVIIKRQKEIDYEIVFAGRHVVIALRSGLPLFDALVGVSKGYGAVSSEFNHIAEKVTLGMPLTQAIRETTQNNPSRYMIRILMQIANSVASGADVGKSVETVLDQISKEQLIQLKEYGQKLTPLVMFFMVFGITLPILGVVVATVIFSTLSGGRFGFTPSMLVLLFAIIGIVQFIFVGLVESSRPKYLL